jgi:hypothetical protein
MAQITDSFEDKFPRLTLLAWPLVPVCSLALAYLVEVVSYAGAYIFIFFTVMSSVAAFFFSLVVLPKTIHRLKSNPVDRTTINYIAISFPIIFDLVFLAGLFVFFRS